jgi:hypothetical protein
MVHIFLIPFVGHHSSFVIGKGGSTIKKLMEETGCFIKAEKANVAEGRPLPFFHIEGPNEKMVNQATIQIQSMLMTSMMRNEKTLKSQNEEMTRQTNFLEMKVADQDEDDGTSDEKDVWIDKLTRKLVEKEIYIEKLNAKLNAEILTNSRLTTSQSTDDIDSIKGMIGAGNKQTFEKIQALLIKEKNSYESQRISFEEDDEEDEEEEEHISVVGL